MLRPPTPPCSRAASSCTGRRTRGSLRTAIGGRAEQAVRRMGGKQRCVWRGGRAPLYSIPHFSFTMHGFPVSSCRNGFGLTGTFCTAPTHIHAHTYTTLRATLAPVGHRRSAPAQRVLSTLAHSDHPPSPPPPPRKAQHASHLPPAHLHPPSRRDRAVGVERFRQPAAAAPGPRKRSPRSARRCNSADRQTPVSPAPPRSNHAPPSQRARREWSATGGAVQLGGVVVERGGAPPSPQPELGCRCIHRLAQDSIHRRGQNHPNINTGCEEHQWLGAVRGVFSIYQ